MPRCLEDLKDAPSWLSLPHVHMKNPFNVLEKINSIASGGPEKLQLIIDFDRTLTKSQENGILTKSTFCLLENYPSVNEEIRLKLKRNLDKYLPIEIDPKLTVEEKIPFMVEWWEMGIEYMKGVEWNIDDVDKYLRQNRQPFRDHTKDCLEQLQNTKVPVLVFSAGIGEVVKLSLKHEGFLTDNVHIVSNFLRVEDGKIAGCQGDIIHVFNKNEQLIQNTTYYSELSGRSNVILLGDSVGDAKMADGVPHDTVLKIGFLNNHIEEALEQYKELFDIVLANDQTMDVLLHILKRTL
ncbi:7-methylguanosine phosphate-specific 5'-nucleotidase A-like [Macrosteles quadrilineatus]|uniref:7-methylguanosine phosphate-specific 5'-nucleotidase A-like n=1 Tax=Macrosteles quadrilineatus TaxID=74068 RepID=UPI0023E3433C|nr:7-methylguanosine phosphate-specific 5'-nucleotidase A-like [Macrosteles quadrilineatus]